MIYKESLKMGKSIVTEFYKTHRAHEEISGYYYKVQGFLLIMIK